MKKFPFYRQLDSRNCGPTCIRMIAKYYGKVIKPEYLNEITYLGKEGVTLSNLSRAAEVIGFKTLMARMKYDDLCKTAPLPLIALWGQHHFVVVYKLKSDKVWLADPDYGLRVVTQNEFCANWNKSGIGIGDGVLLLLETTPEFNADGDDNLDKTKLNFLLKYLIPHKKLIWQLVIGLILASLLQVLFPLLTQSLVDKGINTQNLDFVNLILIALLVLHISKVSVELIRSRILLHLGAYVNISILTAFLMKLMKLPISFFDSRRIGDLLQRIADHKRIESFLTTSILNFLFSVASFLAFGIVLLYYSFIVFTVFLVGSTLYVLWVLFFMKKRRELDYVLFGQMSTNQNNLIQLLNGMQEIKLHNAEREKRWEWERTQAKLFKTNVRTLSLNQYQQAGSVFLNETKNIIISYLSARSVIHGEMSFGVMLSIQYIIGQLNAPVNEFVNFVRSWQEAKISMERLVDIQSLPDEERVAENKIQVFPQKASINLEKVDFHYSGPNSPKVLNNVSLTIPEGKTTAIVGESGGGKTTLLKLLLKFYTPSKGSIKIGSVNLSYLNNSLWREKCGAVMQDGFFFSDTIAKNISVKNEIDTERLLRSAEIANISDYIESLPQHYNTIIGPDGNGLSQGQKQRILIARAVYKKPDYIFFDEATNALDTTNEKIIVENLNNFFAGKTVVIIAHRLSTVMNADQIVVLNKGEIVEIGNHLELVAKNGYYYRLVKNQLELGI